MGEADSIETKRSVWEEWKRDRRMRAYGYIAANEHGCVMNTELAAFLRMSPHGLRQVMLRDPLFAVEIRRHPINRRGCPWYKLSDMRMPGVEPGKLLRALPAPENSGQLRLTNNCDQVVRGRETAEVASDSNGGDDAEG